MTAQPQFPGDHGKGCWRHRRCQASWCLNLRELSSDFPGRWMLVRSPLRTSLSHCSNATVCRLCQGPVPNLADQSVGCIDSFRSKTCNSWRVGAGSQANVAGFHWLKDVENRLGTWNGSFWAGWTSRPVVSSPWRLEPKDQWKQTGCVASLLVVWYRRPGFFWRNFWWNMGCVRCWNFEAANSSSRFCARNMCAFAKVLL